ncbi:AbrB/MazE/SpoVT family DNA-binding domain-containing protein [Candidatus Albibeggiatoa sp. nov. BB20]|uniref:AbrB/MazE/SpoVT family DNA-binding domain-containing protein n=1 Tax=Candidatus Albibeggiatoa sp. nov. BB20 TaxID=3162723 RepID=UPI0033656CFC
MQAVELSPQFQIQIPEEARKSLNLTSGQKLQVLLYQDRIELIPIKPMHALRGFLKGIDTTVDREPDRL